MERSKNGNMERSKNGNMERFKNGKWKNVLSFRVKREIFSKFLLLCRKAWLTPPFYFLLDSCHCERIYERGNLCLYFLSLNNNLQFYINILPFLHSKILKNIFAKK